LSEVSGFVESITFLSKGGGCCWCFAICRLGGRDFEVRVEDFERGLDGESYLIDLGLKP
jgi:hypothetical protein